MSCACVAVARSSSMVVVRLTEQLVRRMSSANLRLERLVSRSCPTSLTPWVSLFHFSVSGFMMYWSSCMHGSSMPCSRQDLREEIVQPVGQRVTLLAEWQWMDSPKDRAAKEKSSDWVQVNGEEISASSKVPRNMDEMELFLRKTRLQHNSIILSHVHPRKFAVRCAVYTTCRLRGNRQCL